jgi:flagellar basal body rod protein FlgC
MSDVGAYLKKHTEALVKDVGVEAACKITGKSKATLGRYYSDHDEHADRFMPVDAVALLEASSSYPHVTSALAELKNITLSYDDRHPNAERSGGVNSDVIALSQRFAMLMAEYQQSIEDGVISVNEAKRLLRETIALQQVLIDMKLHLEADHG